MKKVLNLTIKTVLYLMVILVPLFFLPGTTHVFEFGKSFLLFGLATLGFLVWVVRVIFFDKEIRFSGGLLGYFVLAFVILTGVSAIFSVDKVSSLLGSAGQFSDGFFFIFSLGVMYLLITQGVRQSEEIASPPKFSEKTWAGRNDSEDNSQPDFLYDAKLRESGENRETTRNEEDAKIRERGLSTGRLINFFLWSVGLVVLASYFSIFGLWRVISDKLSLPQFMLTGFFNPIGPTMEVLAVFLAGVVILLVGLILGKREKFRLYGYGILLLASLGLLLMINFQPAWIMILVSLILFLIFALLRRSFKIDINKLLLPIFLILITLFFTFFGQFNILDRNLKREVTLNDRMSWKITYAAFKERPILGSGPGTFGYDFSKFRPAEFNQDLFWQLRFAQSRSYISQLLATLGSLGALVWLALVGWLLVLIWPKLGRRDQPVSPIGFAFIGLLISQFIYYQNAALLFTFWLFLSLISNQLSVKRKMISFEKSPEAALSFSTILIVISLIIVGSYYFAFRFLAAERAYIESFREPESRQRIASSERAVILNPYRSGYRIRLSRFYLTEALNEIAKPEEERDRTYFTNLILGAGNQARRATIISPNEVATWENLAAIYRDIEPVARGSRQAAIESIKKAIELEPTNPLLYVELGKLLAEEKRIDEAKTALTQAGQFKPAWLEPNFQLALIYETEGDMDKAIEIMEELAAKSPGNVEILFQLGRLYYNNEMVDQAIGQFARAVQLNPYHSNSLYSLGLAYQRKGELEAALRVYERVLVLNPENEELKARIEEIRRLIEEVEKVEEGEEQ